MRKVSIHDLRWPQGTMHLSQVAAALMDASESMYASLPARAASRGESISCRKGCAACCRQVIPLSPAEAFLMADLVEALPAGERPAFAARLAEIHDRVAALASASLFQDSAEYFRLGIACPWLKDESCSIHARRPFACREHLVVSDPAYCSHFPDPFIRPFHVEVPVGELLVRLSAELLGCAPQRIPLVKAVEWAAAHAAERERAWDGDWLRAKVAENFMF